MLSFLMWLIVFAIFLVAAILALPLIAVAKFLEKV